MEIRNLEMVAVEYENSGSKVVMTFLDKERKEVRQVNWNLQVFDPNTKKWSADADKEAKVQEYSESIFGVPFDKIGDCVGTLHDVYLYDKFNSLYEVSTIEKFSADMVGQIFQTEIKSVEVGDYSINILYEIDGSTYRTKHTFGNYVESMKAWFVDPDKKRKTYEKFLKKYLVPVEDANELVGHPIMVEVKKAFGEFMYGDIKAFPKPKK